MADGTARDEVAGEGRAHHVSCGDEDEEQGAVGCSAGVARAAGRGEAATEGRGYHAASGRSHAQSRTGTELCRVVPQL